MQRIQLNFASRLQDRTRRPRPRQVGRVHPATSRLAFDSYFVCKVEDRPIRSIVALRRGGRMRCIGACLVGVTFLSFGGSLPAQDAAVATRGKLAAALRRVEQKPSAGRWLGLAEMRWAAGQSQAALDALRKAVAT